MATVLLVALWTTAIAAAFIEHGRQSWRTPRLTLIVCAVTAAGLAAQLWHPPLLGLFQRDAARIVHGQWWRLATALLFQDGWIAGGITNIAGLLLVGGIAEQVLRRAEWLVLYGAVGLIAEGIALFWQPVGAGNSVAICALAGSLIVAPRTGPADPRRLRFRAGAAACALALVTMRDIHGAAAITGAILGALMFLQRRGQTGPA